MINIELHPLSKTILLLILPLAMTLLLSSVNSTYIFPTNNIQDELSHISISKQFTFPNFNSKFNHRVLAQNAFVTCTDQGFCSRGDHVQLQLGWVPKIPLKNLDNIFDTQAKTIESLNPFSNTTSLIFIKGSNKYVCADGVNECFNSCCSKGHCSDPTNICTSALRTSDAIVYISCITYVIIIILYWVYFGYLGARYAKKKAAIIMQDNNIMTDRKEDLLDNDIFQTGRSKGGLDNFDDDFNTGKFNFTKNQGKSVISEKLDASTSLANKDLKDRNDPKNDKLRGTQQQAIELTGGDYNMQGRPKVARNLFGNKAKEEKNNEVESVSSTDRRSFIDGRNQKMEDLYYKNKELDSNAFNNQSPSKREEDDFEIKEL